MTALKQYDRLESEGLWGADAEAQRRDVAVSFGDATLVISDAAGRPLTHWSLAAIERRNPGERPAIFVPAPDTEETLEIEDPLMIDAIETVRKSVARSRPRPRRLRHLMTVAVIGSIAALGYFWLPDALRDQAAAVVPQSKRAEIGATLLGHMQRQQGPRCRGTAGSQALDRLHHRLLGRDAAGQIIVTPLHTPTAIALPGGLILLDQRIVQGTDDPAIAAGYILAAHADRRVSDPISAILATAPLSVTARLLATSDIAADVLRDHAMGLAAPAPPLDELVLAFDFADVAATPYARDMAVRGQAMPELIAQDPLTDRSPRAVMSDSDWVALQGICDV